MILHATIKTYASGHGVFSFKSLEILVWLSIVLPELIHDVLAHVAVILLDLRGDLHLILRGYGGHLTTFSHQVEHELGDVPTGDWDVLDGASDDIALRARDNVGDTITRVNHSTGEGSVCDSV